MWIRTSGRRLLKSCELLRRWRLQCMTAMHLPPLSRALRLHQRSPPPPPPRRTELHATHLCVCVILLVNAFVMSFGFVALGCYMYFYPGLGRDNAAACFRVDCFFVAIFDTVSAHTNSGLAIQTSGYATFVEQ